ncbi:MAG: DUF808 domain-containing protein [Acidimicrobiales bacterium]|nr:DUF808 domain-containing protein [Acidimicrobiales bacterium]
MASGLAALLDDVAALAKLAMSSVDDVGAAAGRASAKAAGVVVDDAAVTPAYVQGLAASRELPIIRKIATGSLRNKLAIILPAALLLSAVAPLLVEVILMFGGAYLAFEGAEKLHHRLSPAHRHDHDVPAVLRGPEAEKAVVASAVRTDFILSTEIMVIALKEVLEEPFLRRAAVLVIVGVLITVLVYGAVALIVKMDDIGLRLVARESPTQRRLGHALVAAMPKLLAVLSAVGTAAMLWVGGHILLVGAQELGWGGPYDVVHHLEDAVRDVAGVGGVLAWLVNTAASAAVGLVVGGLLVVAVGAVRRRRPAPGAQSAAH